MNAYEKTHAATAELHYGGPGASGAWVVLDVAELEPGRFEVVVLRSDGYELQTAEVDSLSEAQRLYRSYYDRYVVGKQAAAPAPLSGRYAKLRDDLRAALAAGRAAEDADPEDGGTCNFDSAAVCLPRWPLSKVRQAAKEAGTDCFVWELGRKHYVFRPDTRGQGNARSRNAEAMVAALQALGYDAMDYCQMD